VLKKNFNSFCRPRIADPPSPHQAAPSSRTQCLRRTRRPLPPLLRQVSLEDLEGAASSFFGIFGSGAAAARHVWRRNQAACQAALGAIGLVYGGPCSFTVLFIRALSVSGWPPVRSVFKRLCVAYNKAKALPARETESGARRAQSLRDELKAVQVRLSLARSPAARGVAHRPWRRRRSTASWPLAQLSVPLP
jgi:hypothetical protein